MYTKYVHVDPIVTLSSGAKVVCAYEVEAEIDCHDVMLGDYDSDYVDVYNYDNDDELDISSFSDEDRRLIEKSVSAAVDRAVEGILEGGE